MVRAVIGQESGGNPNAVSPKGATGLMQVMPATAESMGYSAADLLDPVKNQQIGTQYLHQQLGKYGDRRLALAAYNAGPGRVDSLRAQYGGSYDDIAPHLPTETQNYVPSVVGRIGDEAAGASGAPDLSAAKVDWSKYSPVKSAPAPVDWSQYTPVSAQKDDSSGIGNLVNAVTSLPGRAAALLGGGDKVSSQSLSDLVTGQKAPAASSGIGDTISRYGKDVLQQFTPALAAGGGDILNALGDLVGSDAVKQSVGSATSGLQAMLGASPDAFSNAQAAVAGQLKSYLPRDVGAQQALAGTPKTLLGEVARGGGRMLGPTVFSLAAPEFGAEGLTAEALPWLSKVPGLVPFVKAAISQSGRAATQTAITQAADPDATVGKDIQQGALNTLLFGAPQAFGSRLWQRLATGAVAGPALNSGAAYLGGDTPTTASNIIASIMGLGIGAAGHGEPAAPRAADN
ncbi:MAG: lytic transglycosylase domain-containing protein, partial [Rhodanobacteraceae bacterium]